MKMLMGSGPAPWRRIAWLAVLAEAAYLLYWHVPDAVGHASVLPALSGLPLFGWNPSLPSASPILAVLYTLCMAGAFTAWGLLLRDLSRRPGTGMDRRAVFCGAALFSMTLVLVPGMLSKDLFDYMGHGRVLVHYGSNPFVTPASTFVPDAITSAMGWLDATPLYGPAWASMVAVLTLAGAGSLVGTAILFKLLFALVHLANGWLVMRIAEGWRPLAGAAVPGSPTMPLRAAAFYLWNPLVLTQAIADAHNDGVALFWILLGILLLQRSDYAMGIACTAMSVLVKYVTAPALILILVWRWRSDGLAAAIKLAAVAAAVAALAYAPYLSGFDAGHFLRPYQHASYQGGLMMGLEMILSQALGGGTDPGSSVATIMGIVAAFAAGLLGLWYLFWLKRTRTLFDAVDVSGRFLLFYLLGVTALLRTSYIVWIVGLAAIAATVSIRRTVAIFSATALALEVFWIHRLLATEETGSINFERLLATAVAVGVPILYLLARLWRPARRQIKGHNTAENA